MRTNVFMLIFALALPVFAQSSHQQPQQRRTIQPPIAQPLSTEEFLLNRPSNTPTSSAGEEYRIGRDDLVDVVVFDAPELGGSGRVNASGFVSLPLIGIVEAAGKTPVELQSVIEKTLQAKYVKDPHVTVFVREYASQPVSIIGAVKLPGTYQIKGQKRLLDMLAQAQGLDLNNAGRTIQVSRQAGAAGEAPQTITVSAEDLFQNGKTELNIPIMAGDTIIVLQAQSVFVIGEVVRPGEFPLTQGKNITAAKAIALGSGFTREAKRSACKIIRIHGDGVKEEIPVNVAKILDGSLDDIALLPNDILFVPSNKVKSGLIRTLDTTIGVVSGRLIYRF